MHFQKPGRYIDHEYHAVHKTAPLSVALAFPDIYDVGMSHLGLKILYAIINSLPYASAERVFSPWQDLEQGLRAAGEPLRSLESGRPLYAFDVIGFSLQYELAYTTVLNMLDLGGMPIRTVDRLDRKDMPLVIAGGPCTVNPQPLSPFIDAFLIGDGEEAIQEILAAVHHWKEDGARDRDALLGTLSGIGGVHVPLRGAAAPVRRRVLASLEDAPFPTDPVVPYTNIIHDRINIEISRGCTMGCRFCQAGMIYRPVRERSPGTVLALAEQSLRSTGYDTVSFTSLSSGDYACLNSLMHQFNQKFSAERISLSLPSLRVGSVNDAMLKELKAVRKSGFTIAPEAATDRLRAVINKDFTEKMYDAALERLFRAGWQSLKLYFMIGLPTETDQDIEAIAAMVLKAIRTSKQLTGRHATVSVGVSPFVPKPHTPFQWFGQDSLGTIMEKTRIVKSALLRRGVQYRGHDPEMSMLEASMSRGDENVSRLVEEAWKRGCRLDAWTECFSPATWREAMEASGVDAAAYAERSYLPDAPLPWDRIDIGVSREFLWQEYCHATSGQTTPDCRQGCHACGLDCDTASPAFVAAAPVRQHAAAAARPASLLPGGDLAIRVRLRYAKTPAARYLSHLETTTALIRAMRRAAFPFKYSEGFHPAPRVSFGPALGVGIAGMKEYLDIDLLPPFDTAAGLRALQESLPDIFLASGLSAVEKGEKSLGSFVVRYRYEISASGPLSPDVYEKNKDMTIERKNSTYRLSDMVEEVSFSGGSSALLTVKDLGDTKVRLDELLPLVFGLPATDLLITRQAMFGWDGAWKEPMQDGNA